MGTSVSPWAQATKNNITLKGSTAIVTEFFGQGRAPLLLLLRKSTSSRPPPPHHNHRHPPPPPPPPSPRCGLDLSLMPFKQSGTHHLVPRGAYLELPWTGRRCVCVCVGRRNSCDSHGCDFTAAEGVPRLVSRVPSSCATTGTIVVTRSRYSHTALAWGMR
jgi:hypothetical protein